MTTSILRRLLLNKCVCTPKNFRRISTECSNALIELSDDKPSHIPVMVEEVIDNLSLKEGDVFLDMTFGAGGHTSALLERVPRLKVIALDRDPISQQFALKCGEKFENQIIPLVGKFSDLPHLFKSMGLKKNSIDGVLFDLGCSSMQFDNAERGFSISKNGPLDMRMDGNRLPNEPTAADVLAFASECDLYKILKVYGEEPKSRKIARAIVQARSTFKPLTSTENLCELIEAICGDKKRSNKLNKKSHVATKVFQALRIFVNNEMNELNYGIAIVHSHLKVGGRAVVLSFHSLEDRITKRHFNCIDEECGQQPLEFFNSAKCFEQETLAEFDQKLWSPLHKKVIVPSVEEVCANPRSRSAKLRAAVKCGNECDER